MDLRPDQNFHFFWFQTFHCISWTQEWLKNDKNSLKRGKFKSKKLNLWIRFTCQPSRCTIQNCKKILVIPNESLGSFKAEILGRCSEHFDNVFDLIEGH